MDILSKKEVRIYISKILQIFRNDIYAMHSILDSTNENMPYHLHHAQRLDNILIDLKKKRELFASLINNHTCGGYRIEPYFTFKVGKVFITVEHPYVRSVTPKGYRVYHDTIVEFCYKHVNPELQIFYQLLRSIMV